MNVSMLVPAVAAMALSAAADDPYSTTSPGKPGTGGVVPSLVGKGLGTQGSFVDALVVQDAAPSSAAHLVVGAAELAAPFLGGILGPSPDAIFFGLPVDDSGELTIPFQLPPGIPTGTQVWLQAWIDDAGATGGLSATNTLRLEVQPQPSGPLFPNAQYPAGDGPQSISIGDLDGDGNDDLVTASEGSGASGVVVLLGRDDGTFEPGVRYAEDTRPWWSALGDLDGDGALDIVFVDLSDDTVHTLRNAGDGTFDSLQTYTVPDQPRMTVVSDLEGDGFADVVVLSTGTNQVSALLAVGDGTLAPPASFAAGPNPSHIDIGHVDDDGIPDLVIFSDDVRVWLGRGDGNFLPTSTVATGADGVDGVAKLGDLDGDDVSDLVVAVSDTDTLFVVPGFGDGTFGASQGALFLDGVIDFVITDLDQDEFPDVALTKTEFGFRDVVATLFGNGDGTLQRGPDFLVGDGPRQLTAADFDDDGAIDLAVTNSTGDDITVLLGEGDGEFLEREQYDVASGPNAVDVGDLDGDGVLDLAVTADGSQDGVWLLFGAGEGRVGDAVQIPIKDPRDVAVAHIDADGALDLAVAYDGIGSESGVRVFLGAGDGTFIEGTSIQVSPTPDTVDVVDLDADGIADVVTAITINDRVDVALGVGDGSFAPPVTYAVGNGPSDVVVADFDGDGVLDLAAGAGFSPGGIAVLLGLGDGTFGPATIEPLDFLRSNALAVGDIDGDGVPDLVAVDELSRQLIPLIGQGDGSFTIGSLVDLTPFTGAFALELGDVDGDGVLDAAVTSENVIHDAGVLRGNGDGTFGALEVFGVGEFPSALALADLDGDGLLDLVVTNRESDDVTVLLNQLAK